MTCQKISIFEHQACEISLKIPNENIGDWLCIGSAIRKGYQECIHFNVEPDTVKNNFKITIPCIDVKSAALKFELYEYQIFLKNINTHQEFLVLSGEIEVNKRTCTHDAEGAISDTSIELEATINNNILEVTVSIAGGLSAYEIAKLHGFSGTEEDWISELQGAADAANDAKQSRESAQESLTSTLQAQGKAQEEAQKSESFKNEALGYSQSAALSANNAQIFAETSQAAAVIAEQKRAEAEAAASAANSSKIAAENYENNAKESKEAAITSQLAAEQAALDAQIAQSISEEQARIATEAAAAAQAPESIAAQAARPATMVLLKDELMSILGDAALFDVDTDGQRIIVHTDRLADDKLTEVEDMLGRFVPQFIEVERYNHHIEVAWRDLNRYAACKNYDEMNAVAQSYGFSSFRDDLTSDGWWIYPMNSISGTSLNIQYFFGNYDSAVANKVIRGARIILPETTKYNASANFMAHCTNLEEVYMYAPTMLHNTAGFVYDCPKLTKLEVYVPTITNLKNWCAGCKSLSHFRFLTPLKNQLLYSQDTWKDCVLDVASVQNIAENLPTMTELTSTIIGIDAAYQNDEGISEALALLVSKNWDIALQTNQSPTSTASSTYSLRGKSIYAKMVEIDGEMELCWGHYVTHPEHYQEFSSLEDAYAHFGLEQK